MAEPPADWDQQEDDSSTLSAAASSLGRLNVNAMEFVPSFGSGFSMAPKAPTIPQTVVPKTPPSTPVITRNTTEDEKKQTEAVLKANELNAEQVKESLIASTEGESNDHPKEEIESEFI